MTDEVTHVKTASLVPDSGNANAGTERGAAMLETSLRKYGAGRSILLDKAGRVIAGNKTLQQASDIGIDDVLIVHTTGDKLVAVQRDDLDLADDDTGARALAYADNRTSEIDLSWDAAVIFADLQSGVPVADFWTDAELAELLAAVQPTGAGGDSEAQVDRAAELAQEWSTAVGQVWSLGDHRLAIGDCTDAATVEAVMRGERAEMVFTSPPYAVGVDYDGYEDTIENLKRMLPELSMLGLKNIVDGGFFVINFGDIASGRNVAKTDEPCEYPMALEYWPVFRGDGWVLWSRRVWCKPNPRVHSPWCIQSNRAATDWEHLWTFKKPGAAIKKRVDGELRSALGWYQSSLMHGVDVGKEVHGAGMATGIAEWMVNIHSNTGGVVLEPLCGTGTTIIAAHNLKRKARACELSPAFAAVALDRFQRHTSITPVLL